MFIIFISFTFVLILSVGRPTETKHVPLKQKLTKSLKHIKDMLTEINAKIEHERTLLSQVNDNLNNTDGPPVGRMDFDEPEVTDIWWKTFDPASPSTDLPLHTTMKMTFIQDFKNTTVADKQNYFTAFLTRFMELLAIKDPAETMPVVHLLLELVTNALDGGIFDKLGKTFIQSLNLDDTLAHMKNQTEAELKEKALKAFLKLKNKDTMLLPVEVAAIDTYSDLFTTEQGEQLFQALEAFAEYPKGQKTTEQVTSMIFDAVLEPFIRNAVPGWPHRRSMNLNQSNKHVLLKQPQLLETLIKALKHIKNNKHHHFFKAYQQMADKKYRKNRDEHLNEPKQTRRRAYVPSEEDYNHFEYFRDSIENDTIHKIGEASSYSDDTDQLRDNVHDALGYGNRTFEASKKSGGDVNNKQADRVLSTETDNEWVIKNKIYKVFEQEEERFL